MSAKEIEHAPRMFDIRIFEDRHGRWRVRIETGEGEPLRFKAYGIESAVRFVSGALSTIVGDEDRGRR